MTTTVLLALAAAGTDGGETTAAGEFRLYITCSVRTLAASVSSTSTWNERNSPAVVYLFGDRPRNGARGARARAGAWSTAYAALPPHALRSYPIALLDVDDKAIIEKDMAIWRHAYRRHVAPSADGSGVARLLNGADPLGSAGAVVRWFVRVDDDAYVMLPRLEALLDELGRRIAVGGAHRRGADGAEGARARALLGGTLMWIPARPAYDARRGVFEWVGLKMQVDARERGRPTLARNWRRALGRGEILTYCAGGPGTVLSREALSLTRGFEGTCAERLRELRAAGCPPSARLVPPPAAAAAAEWRGVNLSLIHI